MRLIVVAALLPLAACHSATAADTPGIAGSAAGNGRSYPASGFSVVKLAGADLVDVRVGAGYSVRAEGSPAALDRLRIDLKGDALQIGHRQGADLGSDDRVRLFVTLPRLTGTGLAGSGSINVDRVEGAAFKAELAGSGVLAVATMAVDRMDADLAGSGSFTAAGSARTLNVKIAGSGNVGAPGLTANVASVSIAGSGKVRATVNGTAQVKIMGSGDVDLGGSAHCTVSRMGSGTVHCGS